MTIEIQKPGLEKLIRDRMANGEFQTVEDALIQALRLSLSVEKAHSQPPPKKPLGQFLLDSPLRDSGLKLERQKDYPRPAEL